MALFHRPRRRKPNPPAAPHTNPDQLRGQSAAVAREVSAASDRLDDAYRRLGAVLDTLPETVSAPRPQPRKARP